MPTIKQTPGGTKKQGGLRLRREALPGLPVPPGACRVSESWQVEHRPEPLGRPAMRPMPPGLDVADGPGIQSGPGRHLLLGEPQPEPGGSDPPWKSVPLRNEPGSKGGLDGRPAPRQGLALVPLPRCHRFRIAIQPLGKGSLRQPLVQPAPADLLTKRQGLVRIALGIHGVWAPRGGGAKKATQRCKCGWLGHPRRGCRCTPTEIAQHHARVSGPVLDRIDIQIEVPALTARELQSASAGESSATVRARVLAAREYQRAPGCMNAALPSSRLTECCALDPAGRRLVTDAVDRGGMSARAVHRAMRVARTIADLAGGEQVAVRALAEALQYRAYETRRLTPR